MSTKGIHHITAVAGDPQQNYEFYTQVMGLRLVKKTVNFDDPSVYHLYYGNESGDPGTILTFFPWEYIQDGRPDLGQVVAVSFSVPTGSKKFWLDHLAEQNIDIEDPFSRFGKEIIGLQDPNGLHLELVLDPKAENIRGWEDGPIPGDHSIRGIHGATLAEKNYTKTGRLLEEDLGFELTKQLENRYCYETDAQFGSVIEIIDQFELEGRPEVDRIARNQEGQGAVDAGKVEDLGLGGLPGAIEGDEAVADPGMGRVVGVAVRRRERPLGEGIEDDPGGHVPRRPVERREVEVRQPAGRTLVGVVVALVPDVQVHGRSCDRLA
jgi:catechol 2,3-dioxygenase-like lactoylglutathione lyase family enzyme